MRTMIKIFVFVNETKISLSDTQSLLINKNPANKNIRIGGC